MKSIYVLCVLAVLVGGGQAVVPPKKPCCAPDTWTAYMTQLLDYERKHSTYSGQIKALTEQAYDLANNRVAYRVTNQKPPIYQRFIIDYNEDRLYHDTESSCIYQEFHTEPLNAFCLPQNATYEGQTTMGGGVMNVDYWIFDPPSALFDDNPAGIDVVAETCIPIYSLWRIQNDEYKVTLANIYYNVTTTVKDESIFSKPAFCKEGTIEFDDRNFSLFGMQALYGPIPNSLGKAKKKNAPQSLHDIVNRI